MTLIPGALWKTWPSRYERSDLLAGLGAAVLVLAGTGVAVRLRHARRPRPALLLAGSLACVLLLLGALANRRYQHLRYGTDALVTWVSRHIHHARIAIAGFDRQYPLSGPDFTNYVQYAGKVLPHGGFTRWRSCADWMADLRRGRYSYVVTRDDGLLEYPKKYVPEERWTRTDPGARLIFAAQGASVIWFSRAPDPASCRSASGQLARGDGARRPVPHAFSQ